MLIISSDDIPHLEYDYRWGLTEVDYHSNESGVSLCPRCKMERFEKTQEIQEIEETACTEDISGCS